MIKLSILTLLVFLYGCSDSDSKPNSDSDSKPNSQSDAQEKFNIESSNFTNGAALDTRFSNTLVGGQCNGNNDFPHLSWSSPPGGTESFVIIVQDPDGSDWVHLNLYDIPKDKSEIPELTASSSPPRVTLPFGTLGSNSWSHSTWEGPCPPSGNHRYFFRIYALDRQRLPSPLSQQTFVKFEESYSANILGHAEILGTFQK